MADKGFTFLRWNGNYGNTANFVVKNDATGEQTFFTPGHTQDVAWTKKDLSNSNEAKGWTDFANEHVDNLDDVVF
jgi:hypothetical protein